MEDVYEFPSLSLLHFWGYICWLKKSLTSSSHSEFHISASSKLLISLKHQDKAGFKRVFSVLVLNIGSCSTSLVQSGAWDIYYPCSQQLHEANVFLITAPWSENIQTRSHCGAGTDFPCLPALERPRHHPAESFFPEWGAAFHEESLMTGMWLCCPGVQCHC